jgi:hypothetical protein
MPEDLHHHRDPDGSDGNDPTERVRTLRYEGAGEK